MKIDWTPGSKVYGLPTGNNARHEKGLVEFEVVKMKRKYVTLIKIGWDTPEDYDPSDGRKVGGDWNGGYEFYNDESSFKKQIEINWKRKALVKALESGIIPGEQVLDFYDVVQWPEEP